MNYPVCLDLRGRTCLLVGGGGVALRKARGLLRAGARVTAVSPRFVPAFGRLGLRRVKRRFRASDVRGAFLVIAGTDDPAVNGSVSRECGRRGVPVNVVDVPALCSFTVPSVFRRGPVTVAISTGGQSPALAKAMRLRLERFFPKSLGPRARRIGAARRRILRTLPPSRERTRLLKGLVRGTP